jgi:hypothetical protein
MYYNIRSTFLIKPAALVRKRSSRIEGERARKIQHPISLISSERQGKIGLTDLTATPEMTAQRSAFNQEKMDGCAFNARSAWFLPSAKDRAY